MGHMSMDNFAEALQENKILVWAAYAWVCYIYWGYIKRDKENNRGSNVS